jgi:hypothetical protein
MPGDVEDTGMSEQNPTDGATLMRVPVHLAAAVSAILRGAAVAVPTVATWEMHGAGHDASLKSGGEMEGDWVEINERIYRAMISRSPYPAAEAHHAE